MLITRLVFWYRQRWAYNRNTEMSLFSKDLAFVMIPRLLSYYDTNNLIENYEAVVCVLIMACDKDLEEKIK